MFFWHCHALDCVDNAKGPNVRNASLLDHTNFNNDVEQKRAAFWSMVIQTQKRFSTIIVRCHESKGQCVAQL